MSLLICILIIINPLQITSSVEGPRLARSEERVALSTFLPCGQTALWMMLNDHGRAVPLLQIIEAMPAAADGTNSIRDICECAQRFGLPLTPSRLSSSDELEEKSIVRVANSPFRAKGQNNVGHFVYVAEVGSRDVLFVDPPFPPARMHIDQFKRLLTGEVLTGNPTRRTVLMQWMVFGSCAVSFAAAAFWLYANRFRHLGTRTRVAIIICLLPAAVFVPSHFYKQDSRAKEVRESSRDTTGLLLPERIELGDLALGTRPVNIPLTNGNADAVKVSRIASSCKCVALEFPEAIAAGANGAIEAEIAITEGPGTATITVETNNGIGQIELTWFGASVVRALPPRIHAISRVAGSTLERFFQLRCQGAVGDFEILEITPSDEWLNCFVASSPSTLLDEQYGVAGDQQAATLRLSVDTSKLGIGRRSAVIRIRTRVSQSQNEISIPVAVFLTD